MEGFLRTILVPCCSKIEVEIQNRLRLAGMKGMCITHEENKYEIKANCPLHAESYVAQRKKYTNINHGYDIQHGYKFIFPELCSAESSVTLNFIMLNKQGLSQHANRINGISE